MKKILVLCLLLLGCTGTPEFNDGSTGLPNLYACDFDEDCVPQPSCHPQECVHKTFVSEFEQPGLCTTHFDCHAAYRPEDCVCLKGVCENKYIFEEHPACSKPFIVS